MKHARFGMRIEEAVTDPAKARLIWRCPLLSLLNGQPVSCMLP